MSRGDPAPIVARLDAQKSLIRSVYAPTPGGFDLPAGTAAELFGLLATIFGDRLYPSRKPLGTALPSCTYMLEGIEPFEIDGYPIAQTDLYRLHIRAATPEDADALARDVVRILRTSAFSIEPTDYKHGADEETESFTAELELEASYAVNAAGGPAEPNALELPVALVVPATMTSDGPSEYSNLVKQVITEAWSILLVTSDGNVPALIAEVEAALLGWQQSVEHFDMQYRSGENVGGVANMALWRETYFDAHAITEA